MSTTVQPDTQATQTPEEMPEVAQDAATEDAASEKLVPVSEAIRYRKRAQTAEQRLGDVQAQLEALQGQLDAAHQTVGHLERRQQIDALLAESDAIDMEAARLLTERAVAQMSEPDVKLAVRDLRRHKPYLFRQRMAGGHGAMAPRLHDDEALADHAAEQAMHTGDRRDLLHYLRLRRKP